jgi:hypothetical protein
MTPITIRYLIDQGPEFILEFVKHSTGAEVFAPEFSWLLLAEAVGLRVSMHRTTNPSLAVRWAQVAALLYEGLAQGCRPQDELARDTWTRAAEAYRTQAASAFFDCSQSSARDPQPI